tara:strand:- start:200 stop:1144 length:945 start_codon:yes stop_codon:yes gene_type:complete
MRIENFPGDYQKAKDGGLERVILRLSGLTSRNEVGKYVQKLDAMENDFRKYQATKDLPKQRMLWILFMTKFSAPPPSQYALAEDLFNFLWSEKSNRYSEHSDKLTVAIDDQQRKGAPGVGNCMGLTSLYSVLGSRLGLNLGIELSDTHVRNTLNVNDKSHAIENTSQGGFDIKETSRFPFLNSTIQNKQEFPLHYLVVVQYAARGTLEYLQGNLPEAMSIFNTILEITPNYASGLNIRSAIQAKLGKIDEARCDVASALELVPHSPNSWDIQGRLYEYDGQFQKAAEFFAKSRKNVPRNIETYSPILDSLIQPI